jgi:polysaccharide deacetylase family protein (PEP-CTERM system associated)
MEVARDLGTLEQTAAPLLRPAAASVDLPADWRWDTSHGLAMPESFPQQEKIILSFDVEEHYRIEAAAGLNIDSGLKDHYCHRLNVSTHWVLDQLAERDIKATFFAVGQVARHCPDLVRAIHRAGHEIASHSWDHQRLHNHSPASFREDVRKSKEALEDVTGQEVVGYRAPTFSLVRQTGWAIDILAELGMHYDSSIFPVWHDRYGIPSAPRVPFIAQGTSHSILEFPPATWRLLRTNIPVGGGGYFRLLPRVFMKLALRQMRRANPAVAMLYFHPWEFDPDQARLPLRRMSSFRTYVGLRNSRDKLTDLLSGKSFATARAVAEEMRGRSQALMNFRVPA